MLPKAHCVHQSDGRLRVKIPSHKGDAGYFAHLKEHLSRSPDVSAVKTNAVTGSILVSHTSDLGTIATFAAANNLFTLEEEVRKIVQTTVQEATLTAYRLMDRRLKKLTGGELDLLMAAYLALLGTGAYQLARGRWRAVPWHTALWYAMNLFIESQRRRTKHG